MKYVLILLFICSFSTKAQVLHIDSVGCSIEESDTSYINKMVRHEGQFYNRVFGTHKNDTAIINLNLYGTAKAYTHALKVNKLKSLTNGVYSAELNRSFVYKNDLFFHVVLHAASNNLLHINYPDAPRWLTEGLASALSFTDETGDREVLYTPLTYYNKQLKDLMWKEDFDFQLNSVFMDNNPDWESKTNNGTLHALAWGIVYFLLTQEKEDHLTPVILSMKEGHTATEAFINSYGSFDNFKNKFVIYYRYAAKSRFSAQN